NKKKQLLTHLAEIDDPKVVELLAGYLEDHDEGIRFLVVEQLIDIADPSVLPRLIARLAPAVEDSLRIRTRILDGLATLGWDVSPYIAEISKSIGHEHALSGGKIVHR